LKTDSLFYRDNTPSVPQLVAQTRQQIGDRSGQLDLLDLLETIMVYKLPTCSPEEIQRMMCLPEVDLKQTRFYQDVFTEGRQEGRAEGRQEEACALVVRLLRRPLGQLNGDLEVCLQSLSLPQLEVLADALLDFTTLSNLEVWLSQSP
jgi:predicted transposase YdaD